MWNISRVEGAFQLAPDSGIWVQTFALWCPKESSARAPVGHKDTQLRGQRGQGFIRCVGVGGSSVPIPPWGRWGHRIESPGVNWSWRHGCWWGVRGSPGLGQLLRRLNRLALSIWCCFCSKSGHCHSFSAENSFQKQTTCNVQCEAPRLFAACDFILVTVLACNSGWADEELSSMPVSTVTV